MLFPTFTLACRKSAKNGLDSMSKPFFYNPSECNKLHPSPFAREAKRLIYFYSARFSHFIDSLRLSLKKAKALPFIRFFDFFNSATSKTRKA